MSNVNVQPNVFLAGAPKCGTTSLANWLATHPQCYVVPNKEPHFFGDFLCRGWSLEDYENLFQHASAKQTVRIDASTSYFTNPNAIDQILQYNPDAHFIIMLRNPVDLVYSLYSEVYFRGAETAKTFEEAWRLQARRKDGKNIPLSCNNPAMLYYHDQALLGHALANLLKRTDKKNVQWIFLEDLKHNPRECYLNVLHFLQLEKHERQTFQVLNSAKYHKHQRLTRMLRILGIWRKKLGLPGIGVRSALDKRSKVEAERTSLPNDLRKEIYQSFISDIDLLERITDRDLSHWIPLDVVETPYTKTQA